MTCALSVSCLPPTGRRHPVLAGESLCALTAPHSAPVLLQHLHQPTVGHFVLFLLNSWTLTLTDHHLEVLVDSPWGQE